MLHFSSNNHLRNYIHHFVYLSPGSLQISHEGIELSSTVVLQEVERSMGILDFIEEHALPVVMETMENNLKDVSIQTEGRRILAFFVDDGWVILIHCYNVVWDKTISWSIFKSAYILI